MTEEKQYNEDTMQIIREIRRNQVDSQNKLLKKIISLIAWTTCAYTLFALLLCDKVLGVIDGAKFSNWLFVSLLCGAGIYLILIIVYYFYSTRDTYND